MTKIANDWQSEIRNSIKNSDELLKILRLKPCAIPARFPCKVPKSFISRMEKGNPNDPLLLQVLPSANELLTHDGFSKFPIEEQQCSPIPGLIHKYHGRALLTITGVCAIHCRYCFRQNTDYQNQQPIQHIEKIIAYIDQNEISEIILSGGDPLSLSNQKLAYWLEKLATANHLKRIRIHTRLPVAIPQRIEQELVNILTKSRLWCTIVMHVNHPNELNDETKQHWFKLTENNIMLWNQSVLLKNVNDNTETLAELSRKLIEHHVVPYYVHLLDQVTGSQNFHVSRKNACKIEQELRNKLPGYMMPRFVIDCGEAAKTPAYFNK